MSCHDYLLTSSVPDGGCREVYLIICHIFGEPKTGHIQVNFKLPSLNDPGNTITVRSRKKG
jgi:hypothetical protein